MNFTKCGHTPRLPQAFFRAENGAKLTPREHTIVTARQWQMGHLFQDPMPGAYSVVQSLLATFGTVELERIYRKAGIP